MTLKLKSSTNELWKTWNFAVYRNFTHIACAKNLRGLRQKLDALRVQTGKSLSKYHGLGRKRICCKGISFFWTYYNSRLFVRSLGTIRSHVINFQPFLPSLAIFHAFNDLFWAKWPWNWKALQMNSEKVETSDSQKFQIIKI